LTEEEESGGGRSGGKTNLVVYISEVGRAGEG